MARVATTDVVTNAILSNEDGISGTCVVGYARTSATYSCTPLTDRMNSVDYFAEEARLTGRFDHTYNNATLPIDGGTP